MSDLILKGSTTPGMSLNSPGSASMRFSSTTEKRLVEMIEEEAAARIAADESIDNAKADKTDIPTKVSQLENNVGYLTEHQDVSSKADKTIIETDENTTVTFEFSNTNNKEIRLSEVTSISFTFGDGEYMPDYHSGLSFDSGATPTAIDYTDSGILNWVGTDCTNADGLSIFQPSANTHYDIVFYFNGAQFIGLVNGFVPATGNVVSV